MRDLVFEQLQTSLAGRYVPLRAIGHGAMASVYLAQDIRHDREVAIKALRPPENIQVAGERFLREIRFLARLQHPHILPLFDSGDANGLPYYVTAYVDGESLHERLKHTPSHRLAFDDAVRLATEIGDALDYAHERNILHRDVKPDNILLTRTHAMVADFGIARAIQLAGDAALTETGVAIGTPAYMSPEQLAADRQLDERSDIYALACVTYEMLAGAPPFMGVRGVVDNIRKFTSQPAPMASFRNDLPRDVDNALRRALASDPAARYAAAGDFVRALYA